MKRFPAGLTSPALLVLFVPLAACIPNPDVSGLPPFDAAADDTGVITLPDSAGTDSTLPPVDGGSQDAAADVNAADSAVPVATVSGVVVDYSEANGKGVLAGANVSVSIPTQPTAFIPVTTSDANGLFTIPNVPAGVSIEVSVTKPTDLTNGIAYSRSHSVVTLTAGQTLNLFPIIHEGCFQNWVLPQSGLDAGANKPVTLQNATCPGVVARTGAYAAMTFEATSFSDCGGGTCSSSAAPWGHAIRVEMIPLAYPANDLSWSQGLPGDSTPPALLGAVEYRVIGVDPGQSDDEHELGLSGSAQTGSGGSAVGISVPVYTAPTSGTPAVFSYDTGAATWSAETTAATTLQTGADAGSGLSYQTMIVTHLSPATWWAVTNGTTPSTTCVAGTLAGATGTNALIRAAGSSYLGDTTTTTSGGAFCVYVPASSTIGLFAGAVVGGTPMSTLQPGVSVGAATDAGSCATPSTCAQLGTITLSPNGSCVAGSVATEDGGAVPSALNVFESFTVTNADQAAGIQPSAYVGQATIGTGGAFCALGAPGGSVSLSDPNQCNFTSGVSVAIGSSAACGGGACVDGGALLLNCP